MRKSVGYPWGFQDISVWFLCCNNNSEMCNLFCGFESWVASSLCNQERVLEQLLFRPLGWDCRKKPHASSLSLLPFGKNTTGAEEVQGTRALPQSGIMTTLLFTQSPVQPNPQGQTWGSMRALQKQQGGWADGRRKPRGQQGGRGEAIRGQLCWGAMALAKKPSWDLSYQSQRFTALLYKTVSRWHTFHSNVFGNYQNQGNADILIR